MSRPPTLLLVPDGVAGWAQPEFDGRTPLEEASTPHFDRLSDRGRLYRLNNIPPSCPADSGIANLSLLGYDPREHYLGRGPLEALNLGIETEPGDVAFRCNLVNVNDEEVLHDYSSGNLPTEVNRALFRALDEAFRDEGFRFHPGLRYRGILVAKGFEETRCYLPHDEMGRPLDEIWPEGQNAERLRRMMEESRDILEEHPANRRRRENGELPANMAWPWGNGVMSELPTIQERYGLEGNVVAGVDLINGLGLAVGMVKEDVPGATGDFKTDMNAKARRALEVLEPGRLVYLHVEATDEAGHEGDAPLKVRMIERFDREVVRPVLEALDGASFRVALGPDHYTPVQKRTHVADPVPFLMVDGEGTTDRRFTEPEAEKAPLIDEGWTAMAQWYAGKKHPFTAPVAG